MRVGSRIHDSDGSVVPKELIARLAPGSGGFEGPQTDIQDDQQLTTP